MSILNKANVASLSTIFTVAQIECCPGSVDDRVGILHDLIYQKTKKSGSMQYILHDTISTVLTHYHNSWGFWYRRHKVMTDFDHPQ